MKNIDKNNHSPLDCGRKEDLVAYLYEEVGAAERANFERHLNDCDACRGELTAFGRVRDDLSAWQVGYAPRTEFSPPRSKAGVVREFFALFPAWARGAALTTAAASLLIFALSFAGIRLTGDSEAKQSVNPTQPAQIETLVKEAVAKERLQMREEYRAQMASFKEQLSAERALQIQALTADHQVKLQAVKADLRAEIKKSNRQNQSLRAFFASEDNPDPFGDAK